MEEGKEEEEEEEGGREETGEGGPSPCGGCHGSLLCGGVVVVCILEGKESDVLVAC